MPGLENTEAEALSCPVPVSVPAPNPVAPCFSPNSQSNPSSVSLGSVKPNTALRCESNMCYAIPCLVKQSSILKPKPVSISCSPVLNSDNCSGFLCSMFWFLHDSFSKTILLLYGNHEELILSFCDLCPSQLWKLTLVIILQESSDLRWQEAFASSCSMLYTMSAILVSEVLGDWSQLVLSGQVKPEPFLCTHSYCGTPAI